MDDEALRELLLDTFDVATLERGLALEAAGGVLSWQTTASTPESVSLSAVVRGSGHNRYHVSVEIAGLDGEEPYAACSCTCPVQVDCKHAAALILHWGATVTADERFGGPAQQPANTVEAVVPVAADLITWLTRQERHTRPRPGSANRQVVYQLSSRWSPQRTPSGLGDWLLHQTSATYTRGRPPKITPLQSAPAQDNNPPGFVLDEDIALSHRFPDMSRMRGYSMDQGMDVSQGFGFEALQAAVATGRAFLVDPTHPLRWGEPLAVRLAWQQKGRQIWLGLEPLVQSMTTSGTAPGVEGTSEPLNWIATDPLVWIDRAAGALGPVQHDLPARQLHQLLSMPAFDRGSAELVADMLPDTIRQLLPELPVRRRVLRRTSAPRPILRIVRGQFNAYRSWTQRRGSTQVSTQLVGQLQFELGSVRYSPDSPQGDVVEDDGTTIVRHVRNQAEERRAMEALVKLGPMRVPDHHWSMRPPAPGLSFGFDAARLKDGGRMDEGRGAWMAILPQLAALGWRIEVASDCGLILEAIDAREALSVSLVCASEAAASETDGPHRDPHADHDGRIDWFDIEVGARIGGQVVDLAPVIMNWLRALKPGERYARLESLLAMPPGEGQLLLPLDDGRLAAIEPAALHPVLESLLSLFSPREIDTGALRLPPSRLAEAVEIAGFEQAIAGWRDGSRATALAGALSRWRDQEPPAVPDWFAATLRPYQKTGLAWMGMLGDAGLGGCLADDMGLGKTVQTLAHLSVLKAAGKLEQPALIVAPTSVVPNWAQELARFAPGLSTLQLTGHDRATRVELIQESDIVLTSYPLLTRDEAVLVRQDWSVVVLDEAQMIRNPATAIAKASRQLKARQRLALSGTPVENHLGDLWSLMAFLNPGLLGDAKQFGTDFRKPIEIGADTSARSRLARRIGPFLLRRTRDDVITELPTRTEIEQRVTLTSLQQQLYEATRAAMQTRVREALDVKGLMQSSIVILDALLKLRQCCCDPRLVRTAAGASYTTPGDQDSAKLERLMGLLTELKAEGRKVLVFSQFVSMLKLIAERLDRDSITHVVLTGDTKDRATPVQSFQQGTADVFLISLKAGGTGLNLTTADTVILFDPWWNPAVEAQAIARAHRMGQQRPVFVHRLIAENTIEEKMLSLQARKQSFAEALWDDGTTQPTGALAGLDRDEVLALFA